MSNKILDFIESQETLDNLSFTLKKLYTDDPIFSNDEDLTKLTEKTFEVMEYMERVQDGLCNDPGVIKTSEALGVPIEKVVEDVADVMLMSTVARQSILLELLAKED